MASDSIEKTVDDLKHKLTQDVLAVEDRVPLIQKLLRTQQKLSEDIQIPDVLFDDWAQDDVAGSEHFSRGIIINLRDNDKHAWQELLKSCTSNQREVLTDFTAGKSLEDVYHKFDFGSTRGTRQELGTLEDAKRIELPTATAGSEHEHSLSAEFKNLFKRHKETDIGLYEDSGHKQKLLVRVRF